MNNPEDIRRLQRALNLTLGLHLPLNGVMSFRTRRAIRYFQQQRGLPVDGIVEIATVRALLSAENRRSEFQSSELTSSLDQEAAVPSQSHATTQQQYQDILARIRSELLRRFRSPNDLMLLQRRQELRRLFNLVPTAFAPELFRQLQNRGDPLGRLLTGRVAPATRAEMLRLLQNKISPTPNVSGDPTRTPGAGPAATPTKQDTLPLILAGPIVRRAATDRVWFWFACSKEVKGCAPSVTAYDKSGNVLRHLVDSALNEIILVSELRAVRLAEKIWIILVSAAPKSGKFPTDTILGYDLSIATEENGAIKKTRFSNIDLKINYPPFQRPTFVIGKENRRLVHGSCRRPGADGKDAFGVYDELLAKNAGEPLQRPASLILTGDQIYADDVALPLFPAVRRIAADVFGYVEKIPNPDGSGLSSVDTFSGYLPGPMDPKLSIRQLQWSGRKRLTHRETSPIGFSTDDGEGHLLSFAEYAAMYIAVWNPELCRTYLPIADWFNPYSPLFRYPSYVEACRRVMANTATYMLCDDHEITDDWNLDPQWQVTTKNNRMARRIISNGLAAYWSFQAWGNDPDVFDKDFVQVLALYFEQLRTSQGYPRNGGTRSPYNAAAKYEELLLNTHWSFVAASNPKALCIDTRTRRDYEEGHAILSGKRVQPLLEVLLKKNGFRQGETLLLVTPTPFLPPPYVMKGQAHKYKFPKDRYEGDYELYGNYPLQRGQFMDWLHDKFKPAAVVIFSGDIHHGSVVSGRAGYGAKLEEITSGKAPWVTRIVQITSSAIKNLASTKFVNPALDPKERAAIAFIGGPAAAIASGVDAGTIGEMVVARTVVDDYTTSQGTHVLIQSAVRGLSGRLLSHATLVYENHLCVVDMPARPGGDVKVIFIGLKDGKMEIAGISVDTDNDPTKLKFTTVELQSLPDGLMGYAAPLKNVLRLSSILSGGMSPAAKYQVRLPPLD